MVLELRSWLALGGALLVVGQAAGCGADEVDVPVTEPARELATDDAECTQSRECGSNERCAAGNCVACDCADASCNCEHPRESRTLSGDLSGLVDLSGMDVTIADVRVKPFDGSDGGWLEVRGNTIQVVGTVDASGAGFGGGGGGGGGAGAGGGGNYNGAPGGAGRAVGGAESGVAGAAPQGDAGCGHASSAGGRGGHGGAGGGPFFGVRGARGDGGATRYANGQPGVAGADGGYAGPAANGDVSVDESLSMGSGGGGGGGGGGGTHFGNGENFAAGGGGGGGAGGRGGGMIVLHAESSLVVAGALLVDGTPAGDGQAGGSGTCRYTSGGGGVGGHADLVAAGARGARGNPCMDGGDNRYGGNGGAGGAGAGGGVLLAAPAVTVTASGRVQSLGSSAAIGNGGTLKVFAATLADQGSLVAGRLCIGPLAGPCAPR